VLCGVRCSDHKSDGHSVRAAISLISLASSGSKSWKRRQWSRALSIAMDTSFIQSSSKHTKQQCRHIPLTFLGVMTERKPRISLGSVRTWLHSTKPSSPRLFLTTHLPLHTELRRDDVIDTHTADSPRSWSTQSAAPPIRGRDPPCLGASCVWSLSPSPPRDWHSRTLTGQSALLKHFLAIST
jgi:hypothetical protein